MIPRPTRSTLFHYTRSSDPDRIAADREPASESIGGLEDPGIPRVGREEHHRSDADDAAIVIGSSTLDRANLLGKVQTLPRLPLCGALVANAVFSHGPTPGRRRPTAAPTTRPH